MTEEDAKQVKDLYKQVLTPQVAQMMCEKLDNLINKSKRA
jgi:hypothetical protein